MKNKKAEARLMGGIFLILFGALGFLFWGLGIIFNSVNSIWIGKVLLAAIALIVVIIERLLT